MKNYNSLSDEQLEQVKPLLKKQRELLRFYWDDVTQIEQALASGELVAAYAWNGSVKVLKDQGLSVAYMVPKEGILTWVCGLVRNTDAPGDEQAAYDFIDSMISPESGVFQISTGYGHSNRKAYEMTDPKVLESLGFDNPEEKFAKADVSDEADEPYRSKYIALVNDIKAGVN
jgi:spermidine/putrescine-binding protein